VPIEGRTVLDASHRFADHLNRVLNTTLTQARIVAFAMGDGDDSPVSVSFRERGRATAAHLNTRFGPMTLFIGQRCEGVRIGADRIRLITVEYKYTLTNGDRAAWDFDDPILRWEYVRRPKRGGLWCRHHLQGPITVPLGRAGGVGLNEMHLPTGYVPIEDIIRFCITDLVVTPLTEDWPRILLESYQQFRGEFVGPIEDH
jgi:hypothetical protein